MARPPHIGLWDFLIMKAIYVHKWTLWRLNAIDITMTVTICLLIVLASSYTWCQSTSRTLNVAKDWWSFRVGFRQSGGTLGLFGLWPKSLANKLRRVLRQGWVEFLVDVEISCPSLTFFLILRWFGALGPWRYFYPPWSFVEYFCQSCWAGKAWRLTNWLVKWPQQMILWPWFSTIVDLNRKNSSTHVRFPKLNII